MSTATYVQFDALLPDEIAVRVEEAGIKKANLHPAHTFALAILGGAFISFGAVFATIVVAETYSTLPFGIGQLLGGLAFSLGIILAVVGGAELFTSSTLIVMAWASGRVSAGQLIKNWGVVYLGNFVGAFSIASLTYLSGQYTFDNGEIGAVALSTASSKVNLSFPQAMILAVFGNLLVCLAVWLTFSAQTLTDRILAVIPPIAAFLACGFEHVVTILYYVPLGVFIEHGSPQSFWLSIGRTPNSFLELNWAGFFVYSLLPVTIGNIIGGGGLVGGVYWLVYLRPRRKQGIGASAQDHRVYGQQHDPFVERR